MQHIYIKTMFFYINVRDISTISLFETISFNWKFRILSKFICGRKESSDKETSRTDQLQDQFVLY